MHNDIEENGRPRQTLFERDPMAVLTLVLNPTMDHEMQLMCALQELMNHSHFSRMKPEERKRAVGWFFERWATGEDR